VRRPSCFGDGEFKPLRAELLANLDVGSFHANDDGTFRLQILGSGDDAVARTSREDAAENIDERLTSGRS